MPIDEKPKLELAQVQEKIKQELDMQKKQAELVLQQTKERLERDLLTTTEKNKEQVIQIDQLQDKVEKLTHSLQEMTQAGKRDLDQQEKMQLAATKLQERSKHDLEKQKEQVQLDFQSTKISLERKLSTAEEKIKEQALQIEQLQSKAEKLTNSLQEMARFGKEDIDKLEKRYESEVADLER